MVDYMPKFGYDNIIVGYILSDSRPNAKWKCYGFYMPYAYPCVLLFYLIILGDMELKLLGETSTER